MSSAEFELFPAGFEQHPNSFNHIRCIACLGRLRKGKGSSPSQIAIHVELKSHIAAVAEGLKISNVMGDERKDYIWGQDGLLYCHRGGICENHVPFKSTTQYNAHYEKHVLHDDTGCYIY